MAELSYNEKREAIRMKTRDSYGMKYDLCRQAADAGVCSVRTAWTALSEVKEDYSEKEKQRIAIDWIFERV